MIRIILQNLNLITGDCNNEFIAGGRDMRADIGGIDITTSKSSDKDRIGIITPFTLKMFIVDFLLLILAYGGFYRSFFANSDTLWGALDPSSTFKARLDCYRWFAAIIEAIINATGFLPAYHFRLNLLLFIFSLSVTLLLLQVVYLNLFSRICLLKGETVEIRFAVISAVSLSFVNVLFTEFFYFTETFHAFAFAFLFMGAGIYLLSQNRLVLSFILFICMTMSYQMACPIATICIGVYVYLEHKGEFSLNLIKDEILKATPPMILFVLNYVTGPLVQEILAGFGIESYQEKSPAVGYSLGQYASIIASSVKELVSSNLGLTPGVYLPLVVFAITFIVVTVLCIKGKKWDKLGAFLLVEAVLIILALLVQIASDPAAFIARTVSTLYFAQSMHILIMIFFITEEDERNILSKGVKKILYLMPALYVFFNVFFIQCIIENRLVSETLDGIYAERIFNTIEAYEQETGITVNKIAPVNDTDSSPFYDQVNFCRGAINRRCYSDYTWTFLQYCAYYTDFAGNLSGRSFEKVAMDDDVYKEYFEGINWDYFDEESQIIIRGDTAYICVF